MEIIRRRNNSPDTRRLVEQRNQLSRPGTLRRRYDQYTQRTVFAPSRPNKRSREEIAEIDAEIMRRAKRLGGGYQPMIEEQDEPEELREEGELEIENAETEDDNIIMLGDNLPIVELSKYNTDGKEAKYIQINHIVEKLTSNKKITYKEGGIRVHDGLEDTHCQNSHRSGTNPRQKQHEERRPGNNPGWLPDNI